MLVIASACHTRLGVTAEVGSSQFTGSEMDATELNLEAVDQIHTRQYS